MKYGLKYRMSWAGETGHEYEIEIGEKDYTGEVLTLRQGAAPVLRMDDGDAIRGTSLELTLEAEKDGQLAGFYTTDGKRYHVDLKRDGRIIWQGFTLPELYAEPCVAPPYDVKVTASDGLGLLKNADYEATYGMEVSLLGGIRHITSQTGLSLGFAIANTLMASVMDQSRCMLIQALIRQDALLGMTYYEALEKILKSIGAYITQKDGRWHVVRYTDATTDRTLIASDGYTQEGVMSARILTVGNLSDDTYPLGPELDMEIEPAMRSIEMHQPYELRDSFLSNWDFSEGSAGWQHSANGVKFGWWVGDYYARLQHTRPGSEMSYIEQGVGVTAVDEPLLISFDYGMVYGINMPGIPAGIALEFDFIVMLTEGGRTHYLSREGWQDGACVIKVSASLQAGRLYRDGRSRWYYPETYDTFTVNLEQVPWSGTLTIRILNPYQARPQTGSVIVDKDLRNDLYVKNIKVIHNLPDKEKVDIVLNDAASKADGALNIGFTDVPFTANASLTFANGIRTVRGWTSEWSCAGVASGNFGEMALQSRAGIVGHPKMLMRGTIRAVDFDLVTDKYSGKQLYLRECEYDLLEEEMTVTLCEYRDAGWSTSGGYSGARLAERGGRKVVRKVSETEHRSYTAERSLTTEPKMIRQLRRETAISEDLLLEVDDGASPDTRKATLADLLQPAWKKSELVHDGGYLLIDGQKVKAGDSDAWEGRRTADWMDQPVRKGDGVTFREVVVSEVMKTLGAIDSMAAGKGIVMDAERGLVQADRFEARHSMTVMELIINRLSAMEGDYSFSDGGTVDRLERQEDGTYRLWLRKRWEHDFTALHINDIVYGMINTLAAGGTDYHTSWMRVLHVDTAANAIDVTLYPDTEVPGGKNYPPSELMVITRRGNPVDPERQGYWYLSSSEHCICMLDGVTKPILEEANYSVIVGRLKHLSIFDNLPINYRQSYVYCRGIATQDMMQIDYEGTPVRSENNRGKWSMAEATNRPYESSLSSYDAVYHYGCKWMCLKTGTTQEPRFGCTDWAMIEGNPDFTIDIESSRGWYFDADRLDTTFRVVGELYNRDVTEHILDADITWTRDTGNPTEDNAWAMAHAEAGKELHLTTADLGPDYMNQIACSFTATALLRDGQNEMMSTITKNII